MVDEFGYDDKWAEDAAKSILEMEKRIKEHNYPEPTSVLVTWQKGVYIGVIQYIVPDFSKEIIFLSKSSNPLGNKVAEAIRKIDKGRLELVVDDIFDLTGRYHVARILGDRLVKMTPEQTLYIANHPMTINEVDIKKILGDNK